MNLMQKIAITVPVTLGLCFATALNATELKIVRVVLDVEYEIVNDTVYEIQRVEEEKKVVITQVTKEN